MGRRKIPENVRSSGSGSEISETAFRKAERYWKSRSSPPDLSLAFDTEAIVWEGSTSCDDELETSFSSPTNGRNESEPRRKRRGYWQNPKSGVRIECFMIPLKIADQDEESNNLKMGQTLWKGKDKQQKIQRLETEFDYAVYIPTLRGLVLLPAILPPVTQRAMVQECFQHSVLPNLTSLSAHYDLPPEGLWKAYTTTPSKKDQVLNRKDKIVRVPNEKRIQIDFEPVTGANWESVKGRGNHTLRKAAEKNGSGDLTPHQHGASEPCSENNQEVTISELVDKLRWTTIGWSYDWTSKAYNLDRPKTSLPPTIYECSRRAARSVPWPSIFRPHSSQTKDQERDEENSDHAQWSTSYEPEAGVINFYHLKDSLTAHIDQSEIDAIRPLVSFSLGHSAVFLVGGQTRDIEPLPILLRSGDGLIMSGKEGRRVFHGLPRVIAGTLPSYLQSCPSPVLTNSQLIPDDISDRKQIGEWKAYGEYLERGARINVNVREVF